MIGIWGFLGSVAGAIIAEFTVGWTYEVDSVGNEAFNPGALFFVIIGLIIGLVIGNITSNFSKKLLSAIKENKNTHPNSIADEISKLKVLVDEGIITQEEFDEKKKQLLEL